MASNAYAVFGTLSIQAGRMADATDIFWVRTAQNTWNQIQDYYAYTDIVTG